MNPSLVPSTVETLADLVAYGSGAVVSRTLIKNKAGSVTLFAFDEGQGLSEHSAPFDALVQVLEGTARITVGGTPHQVGAGQLLLMPADIPHALDAVEPFKMVLTMLKAPAAD